jgi:hypothetical protein
MNEQGEKTMKMRTREDLSTATYYTIVPASDPSDDYAAGYDGNQFKTREDAEAAIPALRESGPDFDIEWSVAERRG